MRYPKALTVSLAVTLCLCLVAGPVLAGAIPIALPDVIEVKVMPLTRQLGSANSYRDGFDVLDGQASWVEAGSSGTGPVKYVDEYDHASTIATEALSGKTQIGGRFSTETSRGLVAFRTDLVGVRLVDPTSGAMFKYYPGAGSRSDDEWGFSEQWMVSVSDVEGQLHLDATNVGTDAVVDLGSQSASNPFENVGVHTYWATWTLGDSIYARNLWGTETFTTAARGAGVEVERLSCFWGAISWTERNTTTGFRRIWFQPAYSTEATEVSPGPVSKEMGGFDGTTITWFEGWGTAGAKARAQVIQYGSPFMPGETFTFTGYDPSKVSWDFQTMLWQQRGSDKLFLTRFLPTPTRIIGSQRYATLANIAMLGGTSKQTQAGAEGGQISPEGKGAFFGTDIVVCAGYDNASPDAIVAPGLCGVLRAPMVLARHDSVPAETAAAIRLLRDFNGGGVNIHVIGGTSAISKRTYAQLSALKGTGTIERVGGRDRYTTAVRVAARMKQILALTGETMPNAAMLVNGSDRSHWDYAASTGAISSSQHIPVLFVRRGSVPQVTSKGLRGLALWRRYLIGNSSEISEGVRKRLHASTGDRVGGRDHHAISMSIMRWGRANGWLDPSGEVFLAGHLHEALAAGALGGLSLNVGSTAPALSIGPRTSPGIPVILVDHGYVPGVIDADWVARSGVHEFTYFTLFGGQYSVSDPVAKRILELFGWAAYRLR